MSSPDDRLSEGPGQRGESDRRRRTRSPGSRRSRRAKSADPGEDRKGYNRQNSDAQTGKPVGDDDTFFSNALSVESGDLWSGDRPLLGDFSQRAPLSFQERAWAFVKRNYISWIVLALVCLAVALLGSFAWSTPKPLTWKAWYSLYVIVFMVYAIVKEIGPIDYVLLSATIFLQVAGIITLPQALEGLSNRSVITVGVLFIIAEGITQTNVLVYVSRYVLRSPTHKRDALLRLAVLVIFISSFINNTPLVACFLPIVTHWAKNVMGVPPSRVLIPLSYYAILGGVNTLFGTSTNFVVTGLFQKKDPNFSVPTFEVGEVGLPTGVICAVFIILISPFILKDRLATPAAVLKNPREYTVSVRVEPKAVVVKRSIEEGGLRQLSGLFLIEIQRGDDVIAAPGPESIILAGDVLVFAGVVDAVKELWSIDGLTQVADDQTRQIPSRERGLVAVAIAPRSPLVGKTPRGIKFRTYYGAAIVAVHRRGVHVKQKLGDIILQVGDSLLLECPKNWFSVWGQSDHFSLVSAVGETETEPEHTWIYFARMVIAVVSTLAMIIVAAIGPGGITIVTTGILASLVMMFTGCVTVSQARKSIQGSTLLTIAAAYGLANALDVSGAAAAIAGSLATWLKPLGPLGLIFAIYIAVSFLALFTHNTASVTLIYPIAASLQSLSSGSLTSKSVAYILMMAGSSCFSTPIGYQTNMMVMTEGGYVFSDYTKLGVPLQILHGICSSVLVWAIHTPH